jgi:hypothetical protein
MSKAYPIATVAVLSCALAACASSGGGPGGGAPVDQGPETVVRGESPEALYARIARQVKTCWLSPADPVLKDHLFHAEVPAGGGNKGAVNIVINERTRKNERGLKAFGIDFERLSNGTKIVARNHRLDYALGQKLTADVGFWAQGGETCNPPAAATDSKDNPISGPRVSR